jgi:hypothetical protein
MARRAEHCGAEYFPDIMERPQIVINRVCRAIRRYFPNCGGLLTADGISGVSIIIPVSLELKLPICIVRKKTSHSSSVIMHHVECDNLVFVDDFIESGNTFCQVLERLKGDFNPTVIGVVLYGDGSKQYANIEKGIFDLQDAEIYDESWDNQLAGIIPVVQYVKR